MSDIGALQEPWPNLRLQREGVGLGMWIFLASETLFFAGLFCSFAVYRHFNEQAFQIAASHTEIVYGSINTVLLLTSSLTMTVALRAASVHMRDLTLVCLAVTAALGAAFLVCKGLEYRGDLQEHLFPGPAFPLTPPATQMFWSLLLDHDRHSCRAPFGGHRHCFCRIHLIQAAGDPRARLDHGRRRNLLALRRCYLAYSISPALPRGAHMTADNRDDRHFAWRLWKAPAIAWLVLIVLFAITLGSAYLPLGHGNIVINLVIAALMVGVLVIFLMDLQNATILIRIVAVSGIFWSVLMFALTFNDYLSRHY